MSHDTYAIPAHDDADRDLCADESCGACPPVPEPVSAMLDIHDHPSYGVIDEVFANSSNVVEFDAGAVAVGRCGAVLEPGCIRLAASGHGLAETGLVEPGAASIHLDPATARQLLGELAEALGVTMPPADAIVLGRPSLADTIDLSAAVSGGEGVSTPPVAVFIEGSVRRVVLLTGCQSCSNPTLTGTQARTLATHIALAANDAEAGTK